MEEFQSPFGIYEVKIPVNKNLECGGIGITGNNCKDIDVSVYSEILFYERWEPERTYRKIPKISPSKCKPPKPVTPKSLR